MTTENSPVMLAAASQTDPLISLSDVTKTYSNGTLSVSALQGATMSVDEGEYVAITGPSGSGKSTLMHIIGCLDVPTSGQYLLAGEDVSAMDEPRLAGIRNRRIGFVFQRFHLMSALTALRNVELPLLYANVGREERTTRARIALERVGLDDRFNHRPGELSGGQQQRVAVARALVTNPDLVLADEPTGNLDSRASADVLTLLDEVNAAGKTVVLITHEQDVAARARRIIEVFDSQVQHEDAGTATTAKPAKAPLGRPR